MAELADAADSKVGERKQSQPAKGRLCLVLRYMQEKSCGRELGSVKSGVLLLLPDGCSLARVKIMRQDVKTTVTSLAAARPIAVSESLLRHEAVENALADLRLEGLTPSSEALLLFERYVNGDMTDQDLVNAILAR